MTKLKRNDPCYCGSGKKYKNCCYLKDYEEKIAEKKIAEFSLDDGSKVPLAITSIDSIPTHNKNGLTPEISKEQMMDLCIDEIKQVLDKEKVGMSHDLVDNAILAMNIIPTFTYREIAERIDKDTRFELYNLQICSLYGADPVKLMIDKLEKVQK